MRQITILIFLMFMLLCGACHQTTIGYLITTNAVYVDDSLVIRLTPDPVLDAVRIKNEADWVTVNMSGFEGTVPVLFTIESVSNLSGDEAAALEFQEKLAIRGSGIMSFPWGASVPPGKYIVSVRLTNSGYSQVVNDCFTFIVVE